jgi:hypothetical protein
MVTTTKVAACATAAVLAMTPATALAKSHHSAKAVCTAQEKKMGVKAFDSKYGSGTAHKNAMANCIRTHAKKSTTTTTKKKKKSTSTTG